MSRFLFITFILLLTWQNAKSQDDTEITVVSVEDFSSRVPLSNEADDGNFLKKSWNSVSGWVKNDVGDFVKNDIPGVCNDFSSWCKNDVWSWCREHDVADRLDVGLSLSSMGFGLEVKTPATRWADVRLGVDWLPGFKVPMHFSLSTYADGMPTGSFAHVQQLLYDMTGIELDENVFMNGRTHMLNFKFIVDVFPFQNNRHWHFSAGFFAGNSDIAKTKNKRGEKPTLVGLNIYNRGYEYFTNPDLDIFDVPLGGNNYMDPDLVEELQARFSSYGRMGIHVGDFKDGTPYVMEPAPDGTISAKAYVNHFKPYIGAGYSTDLDDSGKWHFAVDLGAVFWGGVPDVINRDWVTGRDVNFTKDLINVRGKVGTYVKVFKALPVYPMLSVRFSYSIW